MQAKTSFFVALFLVLFFQTVSASRVLAKADAGPDQTVREGDIVVLDGSNSSPSPFIAAYFWQQTGGSPTVVLEDANTAKASFTAPNVGPEGASLTFQLTVFYFFNRGFFSDTDNTIVNVKFANYPPTADAGPNQNVDEETTVTLDGSNSFDPDDGIESYRWKQAAGRSVTFSDPTSARPTFEAPSFDDSGDQPLIFELIVTDNVGLQSSDSTNVSISNYEKDNPGASGGGCFIDAAAYGLLVAQRSVQGRPERCRVKRKIGRWFFLLAVESIVLYRKLYYIL